MLLIFGQIIALTNSTSSPRTYYRQRFVRGPKTIQETLTWAANWRLPKPKSVSLSTSQSQRGETLTFSMPSDMPISLDRHCISCPIAFHGTQRYGISNKWSDPNKRSADLPLNRPDSCLFQHLPYEGTYHEDPDSFFIRGHEGTRASWSQTNHG